MIFLRTTREMLLTLKNVPLFQFFCSWSLTQSPEEKCDKYRMLYLVTHE